MALPVVDSASVLSYWYGNQPREMRNAMTQKSGRKARRITLERKLSRQLKKAGIR